MIATVVKLVKPAWIDDLVGKDIGQRPASLTGVLEQLHYCYRACIDMNIGIDGDRAVVAGDRRTDVACRRTHNTSRYCVDGLCIASIDIGVVDKDIAGGVAAARLLDSRQLRWRLQRQRQQWRVISALNGNCDLRGAGLRPQYR